MSMQHGLFKPNSQIDPDQASHNSFIRHFSGKHPFQLSQNLMESLGQSAFSPAGSLNPSSFPSRAQQEMLL